MSASTMLDELIARYGEGAVLTVSPYVGESGETLRWFVEIDGKGVPDLDVRTGQHPDRPDLMVMLLVQGDDELEVSRWHEDAANPYAIKAGARYEKYGAGRVVWTLSQLRRRAA